jgi:2-dehydropantoate 2-reductase
VDVKFAIVGTGGVGGYLGARLVQAGHPVGFLARGANLAALREHGLQVTSSLGDVQTGPLQASDDPEAIGVADAVFITPKLYDLEKVARKARPLIGPRTLVVPVQNGVEAHEILIRVLPKEAVLKGTIYVSSFLVAPGRILHRSPFCRLHFAPADGRPRADVQALADVLNAAPGIEAAVSADIDAELWRKMIMLAPFAAVASLERKGVGDILAEQRHMDWFKSALAEAVAVARAKGVKVPDDIEAQTLHQMRQFPGNAKPSMLEDLEAGRPLELEYLSGALVRFGKALGVPTPAHEAAYRALLPNIAGR